MSSTARVSQLEQQLARLTQIVAVLALEALAHPGDKKELSKTVQPPDRGEVLAALSELSRELGLIPPQ